MKRSLFLEALEVAAKATVVGAQAGRDAIRTGFATVGALTDCGMRGPVVRDSLWLTAFEEENEVFEAPLSADFDDEPCPCLFFSGACLWCGAPKTPAVSATDSAVEDPSPDVPPASGEADSSWIDFVTPAICDVLADHEFIDIMTEDDPRWKRFGCYHMGELRSHLRITDAQDWRNHVAPLIAARLQAVTLELPEAQ